MTTFGDLTSRLTELVGNNTVFWGDQEKKDALNEAISFWQGLVGEWKEEPWDIPVVSGQIYYSIPRQLLSPTRVSWSVTGVGVFTPLSLTSLPELDYGSPGWETGAVGTPLYWAPNGVGEILIYPSLSGGVIRVEGYSENPRLFSDGDDFPLGEEESVPFLIYAHHYLSFKEGGAELNGTLDNVKQFITAAIERNDILTTTQFYRKYLGLVKEESERPEREGATVWGVRGRESKSAG